MYRTSCPILEHVPSLPVVLLTETWLDVSIADSNLFNTDEYIIFRKDRGSHGGGVLAAFSVSACLVAQIDLEHSEIKALFLELRLPRRTVLICCVYCPPSSREELYRLPDKSLQDASKKNYSDTDIREL